LEKFPSNNKVSDKDWALKIILK